VNLQEPGNDGLRGDPHNPGAGGWPTIRYFNKETGPRGANYIKKTELTVCDELGPDHEYMMDYVEEAAQTSLCSTAHTANCDARSYEFLKKFQSQDRATMEAQVIRLQSLLDGGKIKSELREWIVRRKRILQSLISEVGDASIGESTASNTAKEMKSEL
jgi:hypothetical protein